MSNDDAPFSFAVKLPINLLRNMAPTQTSDFLEMVDIRFEPVPLGTRCLAIQSPVGNSIEHILYTTLFTTFPKNSSGRER